MRAPTIPVRVVSMDSTIGKHRWFAFQWEVTVVYEVAGLERTATHQGRARRYVDAVNAVNADKQVAVRAYNRDLPVAYAGHREPTVPDG